MATPMPRTKAAAAAAGNIHASATGVRARPRAGSPECVDLDRVEPGRCRAAASRGRPRASRRRTGRASGPPRAHAGGRPRPRQRGRRPCGSKRGHLGSARGARGQMGDESGPLGAVECVEQVAGDQVVRVAAHPFGLAQSWLVTSSSRRRWCRASRSRVLAVPSGMPRCSAISLLGESPLVGQVQRLALQRRQGREGGAHAPVVGPQLDDLGHRVVVALGLSHRPRHAAAPVGLLPADPVHGTAVDDGHDPRSARTRCAGS